MFILYRFLNHLSNYDETLVCCSALARKDPRTKIKETLRYFRGIASESRA